MQIYSANTNISVMSDWILSGETHLRSEANFKAYGGKSKQ